MSAPTDDEFEWCNLCQRWETADCKPAPVDQARRPVLSKTEQDPLGPDLGVLKPDPL